MSKIIPASETFAKEPLELHRIAKYTTPLRGNKKKPTLTKRI